MGEIKILSEDVAAAISAGEVVERPLSVVKELVENAIDAGAGRIEVTIEDGGKAVIQVRDNGAGMDGDDLRLCLSKYATSKISKREDLFAVRTMGFRGEALYSIAQVSRLRIITKRKAGQTGHQLAAGPGTAGEVTDKGCADGTTVEVLDLFHNIPARRKFLKTSGWEKSLVIDYLEKAALTFPGITFALRADGKDLLTLEKARGREQRIHQLFPELRGNLMSAVLADRGYSGECFISKPDISMAPFSLFAVNGRVVKDKIYHRAVNDIFSGQRKKSPFIYVDLRIPEDELDVNVHPAKSEVKFQKNEQVYRFLRNLIEQALLSDRSQPVDAGSFPESLPAGPAHSAGTGAVAAGYVRDDRPYSEPRSGAPSPFSSVSELFSGYAAGPVTGAEIRIIGAFAKGFLLVERDETLFIIDQHAAHERFIFNRLVAKLEGGELQPQKIMPYIISVTPGSASYLAEKRGAFEKLGFSYEEAGPGAFALTSVPSLMDYDTGVSVFSELMNDREILRRSKDIAAEVLMMAACREAVKKTDRLAPEEIEFAVTAFLSGRTEKYCPHGRNYVITITLEELEKKFGRKD